ncbi:MAG: right-handed parallel beta-helix repeat-containing protein [Candidatus Heimdallarchaeota archaeon]|nr:right-handed parallel beta-helix repeat-containing protein [Candidatus Heimdallarchaeota archaeon]
MTHEKSNSKIIAIWLGLFLIFAIVVINSIGTQPSTEINSTPQLTNISLALYNDTGPIVISGNGNASGYPGSGTPTDPYIISNFNFTGGDGTSLLLIEDTTDYIIVKDNLFTGGRNGIKLDNINNTYILNNNITGALIHGVVFVDSFNTRLEGNDISYNGNCNGTLFLSLATHGGSGGWWDPSGDSVVVNNTIHHNKAAGLTIEEGTNITIMGNDVSDNGMCSHSLLKFDQEGDHPQGNGIEVKNGTSIDIEHNNITGNQNFGVDIWSNTSQIDVRDNNFVNNGLEPQANDNGTDNIFDGNFWDDWISGNYSVSGTSDNDDLHPRSALQDVYFDQKDFLPQGTLTVTSTETAEIQTVTETTLVGDVTTTFTTTITTTVTETPLILPLLIIPVFLLNRVWRRKQ